MGANCLGCPKPSSEDKDPTEPKSVAKSPESPPADNSAKLSPDGVSSDQGRKQRVKKKKAAVGMKTPTSQVREAVNAVVTEKEKTMQDKELIALCLQSQFIYSTWTDDQRAYVINAMKHYALAASEIVFEQGQPAVNFFVVASGEVEVISNGVKRNVLRKGAGFGEGALLHNVARTATIKTITDTMLWGLDRDTFKHFIEGVNAQNYEENKHFINSIQMFQVLTPQQKEDLLQALQSIHYPSGSRIVTQGDQGEVCYIIREGSVVCTKDGKEIRRMGKGEIFGEQALLYGGVRTATITAADPVKCVSIGRTDLQNVLGSQLLQVICRNSLRIAFDRSETLRRLNSDQSDRLILSMRVATFNSGQVVIPQGTVLGSGLWVVLKGSIRKSNLPEVLGDTFACIGDTDLTRNATGTFEVDIVVASENADIAQVTKQEFEQCIGGSLDAATQNNEVLKVLKRVQLLRSLPNEKLLELTRALRLREYADKEVIVKQNNPGDSFFIIESGRVDVFRDSVNLRTITKHDYFGERSVLFGDARTATIIAKGPVACWILEKSEFYRVIDEAVRNQLMKRIALQDDTIALADLVVVKPLGKGMFGSVYLTTTPNSRALYALKSVSRVKIEKYNIKDNILLERKILLQLDHTMILKLVKTYKDATHLYFLTEFVRGLDFFDVLRKMEGLVSNKDARFYTGCMMLILEHLHERDIIYRDLKPENIMIDEDGYMKLIDFGTAKIVQGRTYTIVGTPHYMAPEVIIGKGYGMSADYWSMGAILFECICGRVPFGEEEEDPYQIYEKILQQSITYPPWVKADIIVIIKGIIEILLSKNPAMRTGGNIQNLRTNSWFKGFNWGGFLCYAIMRGFLVSARVFPTLLLAVAFEATVETGDGWHYVRIPAEQQAYLLIDFVRGGDCQGRELLAADTKEGFAGKLEDDQWRVDARWADLEGWATRNAYHSLSVPGPGGDICTIGLCTCTRGWVGIACDFPSAEISLSTPLLMKARSSLVSSKTNTSGSLRLQLLSGAQCQVLVLRAGKDYRVPGSDYFSDSVELAGRTYRVEQTGTVVFMAQTENPPVVLYLEATGTVYPGSSDIPASAIVTGAIIGSCLLAVMLMFILALLVCRKRISHRIPRVISLVPDEPPAHNREEVIEFLDASFPVQQYVSLSNPICTHCVVCLEQFTVQSEVRTLACSHTYHVMCVEALFQAQFKCGVCNRDYSGIEATGRSSVRLIEESQSQGEVSEVVSGMEGSEEQQIRV